MNKWEIYWAKIKFEDIEGVKRRPVLVLNNSVSFIMTAPVTSHVPRTEFEGEYKIKNWKKAGLEKESTVRLSKRIKLESRDFDGYIGKLDSIDIFFVEQILSGYMK